MCDSSPYVAALLSPHSSEATALVESRDPWIPRRIASFGELVVWSEVQRAEAGSRLSGYNVADGQGVRTVLEHLPGDACEVAINRTHIAGSLGNGAACNLVQQDGRLWAVERSAGPKATASLSPVLYDKPVTFFHTATNGRYLAATMATYPGEWAFLLARVGEWTFRFIPDEWPAWFTMTSRYLYVMTTFRNKDAGKVTEIRRYDLDHFDRIGEPYVGVMRPREALDGYSGPDR
ncbi:MAG TPA: hypothetical protein VGE01_11230 [Fimbriimonas sp.]